MGAGDRWQTRRVHRLYPLPSESVDFSQAAGAQRVSNPERPWVMLNMVASIDGAAAIGGLSRGLSSTADRELFAALRAEADVILVGARTANSERYGPARKSGARVAVVSGSLSVDCDLPLFSQSSALERAPLPLVVTTTDADPAAASRLTGRAELIRAGSGTVDLPAALQQLSLLGARIVLCEGGPALNASLLAADLVDELNLTQAPLAVGTAAPRIISDGPDTVGDAAPRGYTLAQVVTADGALFVRWVRSSD